MQIERLSNTVSNQTLLYIRILFGLITLVWNVWRTAATGWVYFLFLTDWNWIMDTLFFFVGASYTYAVINNGEQKESLRTAYIGLFAVCNTIGWIVSVGFWLLLNSIVFGAEASTFDRYSQTWAHTFNLFLPLIDLFLSKTNMKFLQVGYPICALLAYQAMVLICHGVYKTEWPYPFMTAVNGGEEGISWGPMLAMGAAVSIAAILFYSLVLMLIKLRNIFFPDKKEVSSTVQV
ncbi:hypothetical protein BC833DRAFT_591881 [Globomyces pollinis-pini]|nr:hypothetical protein BC833DRAFT_591881 [Globomyces pollinis-pini]